MRDIRNADTNREPPPIGGTWGRLYAAVIIDLVLTVLAVWLFSWWFS